MEFERERNLITVLTTCTVEIVFFDNPFARKIVKKTRLSENGVKCAYNFDFY